MAKKILTAYQQVALKAIAASSLSKHFYFTGGTALSHYYLQHRLSEDLDFFNQSEFSTLDITLAIKGLQSKIGYKSLDIQTSFNRNIFHLASSKDKSLKIEFTYFPFPQIQQPKVINNLKVDSLIDIAVNKLFIIAQKPRGRDYYDLFYINKLKTINLDELRLSAKRKFDWHVDPLQLGSKLHQVDEFIDDPILTRKIPKKEIVKYFKQESKKLKPKILKK